MIYELPAISLEEIGAAKLMNRVDTKDLSTSSILGVLLERMISEYMVLEIEGERVMPYYTRYYDTADANMFYEHQRGRKARQKIRLRRYESGDRLTFLEIKDKDNKGRTRKKRREMMPGDEPAMFAGFVAKNSHYTMETLSPWIENRFNRITLVRNNLSERITIDTGLAFHNLVNGNSEDVGHLMIIEWKREAYAEASPMSGILRTLHIRQSGFSKYCTGMALTDPGLRQNRMKPKLRMLGTYANMI